jgi:hypothetical protein
MTEIGGPTLATVSLTAPGWGRRRLRSVRKKKPRTWRGLLYRYIQPAAHSALLFALSWLLRVLAALVTFATLLLPALPVRVVLPALLLPAVLAALLLATLSGIAFRRHTTRIVWIIHLVLLGVFSLPRKQRPSLRIVHSVRHGATSERGSSLKPAGLACRNNSLRLARNRLEVGNRRTKFARHN